MKKVLLTIFSSTVLIAASYAGGLLTNTNQSVHFLRNPARDASIEIDAAYTNPAGLAKLTEDGFHFSLNNQSAFQTRTVTSTFAPFAGFEGIGNQTRVFKGEASAPIVPSLQAAYKKGKWVLSGNVAVTGGGGKATFNKGLPSFESTVAVVPAFFHNLNPLIGGYSLSSYMEGSSFIYGAQLGGTYAINDMFAAYAGFRLNIVNNAYEGYMRDIKVGVNGTFMPAADVIAIAAGINPAAAGFAPLLAEKELSCKQSGWGITPVLGFNFNWKQLNVGMKYEFKTNLNVENKTKINTTGVADFENGVNTPHDIPALFTVGASYKIIPEVSVSLGYHHFFDSNAEMANNKQEYINGGVNEFLAGAEWQINDMFLISAGGQLTRTGVTDDYQQDLSYSLNSYSIGFGGAINVSKNIRINLAYFWTTYQDWTKKSSDYGNVSQLTGGIVPANPGTDVFSRTNKVFGVGVDFRF